ncbi:hypothetical protein AO382_0261 [Moraxella catarrhalis]|uniref:Uncharacterized protein n=1 Tax=Moraxella catarrhalis TaxID=480 RepID=A0A7Z0V000_MORCA|nr:hypothetical protein AO382_0261 [Moraxella catarrhalis]
MLLKSALKAGGCQGSGKVVGLISHFLVIYIDIKLNQI